MPPGRKTVFVILLVLSLLFLVLLGWQQLKGGETKSLTAQLLSLGRRQPDAIVNLDVRSAADWSAVSPAIQPKIDFCDFNSSRKQLNKDLIINEAAWMGTVEDSLAEWIELKNISNQTLSVSGYQLIDKAGQIGISLPTVSLTAGGFFLLVRENDSNQLIKSADLIYKGALSNTDESLKLFDKQCWLVDEAIAKPKWPAGDNKTKQTMERVKDLTWQTSLLAGGTPKKENSLKPAVALASSTAVQPEIKKEEPPVQANSEPIVQNNNVEERIPPSVETSPARVLINEIFYNPEGADIGKEFVELFNAGGQDVDLSGWSLKNGTNSLASIGAKNEDKKIIKSGGYFLIGFNNYNSAPPADVVRSASLPNTSATINLYDSSGSLIESVSYNNSVTEGQSYERISWDNSEFKTELNPNPQNSQNF